MLQTISIYLSYSTTWIICASKHFRPHHQYRITCTTRSEENQATAIGNMHKKFGEDQTCSSGDMTTDRQTDTYTHTHHNTSRSPVGSGVKNIVNSTAKIGLCLYSLITTCCEGVFLTSFDVMQTSIASVWTCVSSPLTGIVQIVLGDRCGSRFSRRNASVHSKHISSFQYLVQYSIGHSHNCKCITLKHIFQFK